MRTNFTHLKEYPEYYELAVSVERRLLDAKNQADFKMAGNSMRQILEGMLQEVMRKYKGYVKDTFSGNFYSIKNGRIMDWDSLNNIEVMKECGNSCSHPHTCVTKREVMEMYGLLYKETYKMTSYYLTDKAIRAYKKEQEHRRQENRVRYGLDKRSNTPVKATFDTPASPAQAVVVVEPAPKKHKNFCGSLFTAAIWFVTIGFVVSVMITI